MKTCIVEGCDRRAVGKGLCMLHHKRMKRLGEVGSAKPLYKKTSIKNNNSFVKKCNATGCEENGVRMGLCESHLKEFHIEQDSFIKKEDIRKEKKVIEIDSEIQRKIRRMARMSQELNALNLEVISQIENLNLPEKTLDNLKQGIHEFTYENPDVLSMRNFIIAVERGKYE